MLLARSGSCRELRDMTFRFAEPIAVDSPEGTFFYHVTELPGFGIIEHPTSWDLRGRFADYTGGVEVRGRSFLDVGAGSGFLSFESEKQGAEVIGFDAEHAGQLQFVPYAGIPEQSPAYAFEPMRRAYWLSHRSLGSHV